MLGRFDRHDLRLDGPEHVLCYARLARTSASVWSRRRCWHGLAPQLSMTQKASIAS